MTARYLCTICSRTVARTQVDRHFDAHVRSGIVTAQRVDAERSRYNAVVKREREALDKLDARVSS